MPFQGQKLKALFSHSKTFMYLSRCIINMCLLLLKHLILIAEKKPDIVHTLTLIPPSKYLYLSHCPGLSLIGKSLFCPSHVTEIDPKLKHRTTNNEWIHFFREKWKLPSLILFLLYWCGCMQKESISHPELRALVSVALLVETVTFLEPGQEGYRALSPPWKLWMVSIWKMFVAGLADSLVSWFNQEMRKDIHFYDDSERLHHTQRRLSAACVLITGHEQRTWLGSWAMPLIQSSNSPPAAFWGQWTLWVSCQLQKTKVDPRTVGYFWRLDRITADWWHQSSLPQAKREGLCNLLWSPPSHHS